MNIVDSHTHAFPDDVIGKAWLASVGVPDSKRSGYIDELGALLTEAQIGRAVILLHDQGPAVFNASRKQGLSQTDAQHEVRRQVLEFNNWGCNVAKRDGRFLPFVGVNARFMSADEIHQDIVALKYAGARGVKILPTSMRAYPNNPMLNPIFEACVEVGLPLLSQSGVGTGESPDRNADPYGRPKYWAEVLMRFPTLTLILAHMGQGFEEDIVELTHKFPNVYTDTSMRLSGLGKPGRWTANDLVKTMRRIGIDRVLFGSNYPFTNPSVYATILQQLPLTDTERRSVAAENFERLIT